MECGRPHDSRAARAAHDHDVAGGEPDGAGAVAPGRTAEAEQSGVAERQRHHRGGKIRLVLVAMKTHAGAGTIMADKAGLGIMRITAELAPELEQEVGHRRPRLAGDRWRAGTGTATVGYPREGRDWSCGR